MRVPCVRDQLDLHIGITQTIGIHGDQVTSLHHCNFITRLTSVLGNFLCGDFCPHLCLQGGTKDTLLQYNHVPRVKGPYGWSPHVCPNPVDSLTHPNLILLVCIFNYFNCLIFVVVDQLFIAKLSSSEKLKFQ